MIAEKQNKIGIKPRKLTGNVGTTEIHHIPTKITGTDKNQTIQLGTIETKLRQYKNGPEKITIRKIKATNNAKLAINTPKN